MVNRGWSTRRRLVTMVCLTIPTGGSLASCSGTTKPPADTLNGPDAAAARSEAGPPDATTPLPDATIATIPLDARGSQDSAGDALDAAGEAAAADSPFEASDDGSACRGGQTFCGGACTDTSSDPTNCGQCTNACGKGVICNSGQCACPPNMGQLLCNGTCVTIATDENNCGACGHSCQGSTCSNNLCQPTAVAQPNAPLWDIGVDSTFLYWTQIAIAPNVGAVSKKPFAGTATIFSVSGDPLLDDPHGIAVDQLNMYWVDYSTGAVESYPLQGGQVTVYQMPAPGGTSPHPIDIVTDGQNVYWVTFDGGQVLSEPIAGGVAPTVIASGEDHPHAIAVDENNVYWVDLGNALSGTGLVKQAPKNAAAPPATPITLSKNEKEPWDIAVDATSVYWTDRANPGEVKKILIGGSALPVTLAQMQGAPYGIAVDADYVYWTNFDDNTVMRLPKTGGQQPFALASGQNNPASLAVDARNVYWANGAGTILKVAK